MQSIEPHIRPNISRLEKWREDIAAMRRQLWPYTRIAQWLLEQHGLQISDVAIRKFCNRRNIKKGTVRGQHAPHPHPLRKTLNHYARANLLSVYLNTTIAGQSKFIDNPFSFGYLTAEIRIL